MELSNNPTFNDSPDQPTSWSDFWIGMTVLTATALSGVMFVRLFL